MSLIPNDDLLLSDLPPARASWTVLRPFCATFDGYKVLGRRLPRVARNPSPGDISELRGALFFEFRAWVWTSPKGAPPSTKELAARWWPILELIRKNLRRHPPKRAFKKLTMARTWCYGKCPVYKVSVDAVGNVRWVGKRHVRKLGRAAWKVSRENILKLRALLREEGFGSLRNSYPKKDVSGQADCITSVHYTDGRVKRVAHHLGDRRTPEALRSLEQQVDKLLGTWKRMGPMPKAHHGPSDYSKIVGKR